MGRLEEINERIDELKALTRTLTHEELMESLNLMLEMLTMLAEER